MFSINYSKNQLRHENSHVPYLVDETLREGVERCPFPISLDSKMQLLQEMADVGLRDFIVGCGPGGSLQPHLTHQLCSSLVKDYPETTFCLHAHNDTGLAVANSMAAIQAGFQMIEGSLAGFGNRSGIAPTEQVLNLCEKNNIKVGHTEINIKKLSAVARFSEDVSEEDLESSVENLREVIKKRLRCYKNVL
jgi:isopropylmalate/homocitrate/citramalate synthase